RHLLKRIAAADALHRLRTCGRLLDVVGIVVAIAVFGIVLGIDGRGIAVVAIAVVAVAVVSVIRLLVAQQRLTIGDGDLVVVGSDVSEVKNVLAVATILDEGSMQGRRYARDFRKEDVAARLPPGR